MTFYSGKATSPIRFLYCFMVDWIVLSALTIQERVQMIYMPQAGSRQRKSFRQKGIKEGEPERWWFEVRE